MVLDIYLRIVVFFNANIYQPGFLKRWLLNICPFSPERHRNWVFLTPMSLETTREKKEKGGERGEKKKRLLALIIFILPTLEIVQKETQNTIQRYELRNRRDYNNAKTRKSDANQKHSKIKTI